MKNEVAAAANQAVENRRAALTAAEQEHAARLETLREAEAKRDRLQARERDLTTRIGQLHRSDLDARESMLATLMEGDVPEDVVADYLKLHGVLEIHAQAVDRMTKIVLRGAVRAIKDAIVEERIAAGEVCRAKLEVQRATTAAAALNLMAVEGGANVQVSGGQTDALIAQLAAIRREAAEALQALDDHDRETARLEGTNGR